jgi:hypothetical protein
MERLDEKSTRLKAELAKYTTSRRPAQVALVQADIRDTAVERRKLLDMLIAIGHSFPCRHDATPEPQERHED